jgi:dipeptidyl aminopeptidase/acylaminoacyl peptidase
MNDISRLLEYLDEKRSLWKLGNKTAITGVSAGAHLGMLYAYGYNTGNKVKAIVSVVGPADFSDPLYVSSPIFQLVATSLLGKSWIEDANLHRSASPALRVSATSPPTFMAYGALDQLVPLSNAATLRSRLQANNITHTYVEYPAEGHEFTNTAINDLVPRVISFLKTNL